MVRSFVLAAALVAAGIGPLDGFHSAGAQDAAAQCASALWLEPLTAAAGTAEATPAEAGESAPAWTTAELTDACSGQSFSLADFAGKTVYVEAMATWCPPCRDQLARVKEAAAQIPEEERGDIVFVALSSEVDLPRESLAAYAEDNGFPFVFAVMPAEMLRAMADDLGQEIAVPPATPHLIVAADGTVGELHTGSAAPEEILALLAETRATPGS
ncbi:MAG: TlpA family protein disulfide reductase [Chloroflexota bacterium]|nr:TlpA family protein disulfide reductase [Chloroflexota bacterium]